MESQTQNPECRNNPENFPPWIWSNLGANFTCDTSLTFSQGLVTLTAVHSEKFQNNTDKQFFNVYLKINV